MHKTTAKGETVSAQTFTMPSGAVTQFAGSSAPQGWLICDGSTVARTTYSGLFTAIGTTYNTGGEAGTDFRLPDLRGRGVVGKGSNTVVDTLGKNEGVSETNRRGTRHQHTPHNHPVSPSVSWTAGAGSGSGLQIAGSGGSGSIVTSNADGGSGVATDPLDGGAFLVLNYIIKT